MELRELLGLCQYGDHAHEWVRVPSGPAEQMPTGFIDVASNKQPPALAALQPNYLAAYTPDSSLTLAWGYPFDDWRDERPGQREREDWQPDSFKSGRRQAAVVFYCGAPVWQVTCAYADWGSGVGMSVPWPRVDFARDAEEPTYWVTEWEIEVARLISEIQRETQMDLIGIMVDGGVQVRDLDPIAVEQEGW